MNMAYGRNNGATTIIVVHNENPPTDEEWRSYLKFLERAIVALEVSGILVYTAGGAPTAPQRVDYAKLIDRHRCAFSCAVVSDSALVRGVVTAFAWWTSQKHIRSFMPTELRHAMGFAGVEEFMSTETLLRSLARVTGTTIPSANKSAA